ncbi:MAG: hypothetical protein L0387_05630 [Acidobacteria bacterium]|nr:hypothetical protein [Acidobacteriota bacterium]MCI0621141.1 hypothetical protein [Acidobacteriota bacterium]MCI0719128.1 hypothetical protein [Acidobacteriota bacterium]
MSRPIVAAERKANPCRTELAVTICSVALPPRLPASDLRTSGGLGSQFLLLESEQSPEVSAMLTRTVPNPHPIEVRVGNFTAAQYAALDSPALWACPIFPDGFHAPNLMQLAQLQT